MSKKTFSALGSALSWAGIHGQSTSDRQDARASDTEKTDSGFADLGLQALHANSPVETSFGALPAQYIRRGDPIRVAHDDYLPVDEVKLLHFDVNYQRTNPEILPITLEARTAYANLAKASVVVSPKQLVRLRDGLSTGDGRFLAAEVLKPRGLISPSSVTDTLTYVSFTFAKAVCICSGGHWLRASVA